MRAGRPAARILSQVGIDRARIETPGRRIPFARHAALLEAAAEDLADDLLGLRFGITRDVRDTGLIGYGGSPAPGVRSWSRWRRASASRHFAANRLGSRDFRQAPARYSANGLVSP